MTILPRIARELHIQSIESNLNRVQRRFLQSNLIHLNDKSDYTVAVCHQSRETTGRVVHACKHQAWSGQIKKPTLIHWVCVRREMLMLLWSCKYSRNIHMNPEFLCCHDSNQTSEKKNSRPVHGYMFPTRKTHSQSGFSEFRCHLNTQLKNSDFVFLFKNV